ncbi:hypothetical protein BT69DRAFT_392827 [Atractiella rhizophila]|nr:hypothetical protein BT69DRAFT_392827 [Atractiella rhizophila]
MLEVCLGLGQHEAAWFINFLLLRPILWRNCTVPPPSPTVACLNSNRNYLKRRR